MKVNIKKILIVICILVLVGGTFWGFHSVNNYKPIDEKAGNYTFYLDGENMTSILVCEEQWHYELIDDTIPCVVNKTIGGITSFDWTLSPQDNCANVGGEFPGLNMLNETRAKELYDQLLPKCFEFYDYEISYIWLNASNCICDGESSFSVGCGQYNCGGGLVVKKNEGNL